jgi:hypothetical protein
MHQLGSFCSQQCGQGTLTSLQTLPLFPNQPEFGVSVSLKVVVVLTLPLASLDCECAQHPFTPFIERL